MAAEAVGVVQALARYPVKSLRGEWCDALGLEAKGIAGDRTYAVYGADGKIGSGKTTRRFRRMNGLLQLEACTDQGAAWVRLPSGQSYAVDDPALAPALSDFLGEPVTVRTEEAVKHLDDSPVHVVTTASLRWVGALGAGLDGEAQRFRPNLVIDAARSGRVEDEWVGHSLLIGTSRLRVTKRTERCVMPAQPQDRLPFLPTLLRALTEQAEACLGVYADVEEPGEVRVGDPVRLET